MQRFQRFVPTVIVLVLSLTATSIAQDRGGRGGRRGMGGFGRFGGAIDKPTLLGSEQVRKELKVNEEQGKKIDEVLTPHREASGELMRELFGTRDLSEEERAKVRAGVEKKRANLNKKTAKQLAKVLEKGQVKRLEEISLQQQGVDGLAGEYAIAALKLNKETVKKIKSAIAKRDEERRKARESMRSGGGGFNREAFDQIREKNEKLRAETEKTILACLTQEQKEAFEKLKGEPFELDRRSLFPRRGGRGAGGRQGGGEDRKRRRPDPDDDAI